MIEELQEYLVRHGWSEDLASDIHDAYYDGNMEAVERFAKSLEDVQHDYVEEISRELLKWKRMVGEE